VFSNGSNIKKYCKENNIEYFSCYETNVIDIDTKQIKNNKINILEQFNIYGDCKETIIYNSNFQEIIEKIKKNMKMIPSNGKENKYYNVELYEDIIYLLDGSVVYDIGYKNIMDSNLDITYLFYERVLLITNIPILTY
jgi:hypothetical protein